MGWQHSGCRGSRGTRRQDDFSQWFSLTSLLAGSLFATSLLARSRLPALLALGGRIWGGLGLTWQGRGRGGRCIGIGAQSSLTALLAASLLALDLLACLLAIYLLCRSRLPALLALGISRGGEVGLARWSIGGCRCRRLQTPRSRILQQSQLDFRLPSSCQFEVRLSDSQQVCKARLCQ